MKKLSVEDYVDKLLIAEAGNRIKYDIGGRGGNYTMEAELALELVGATGDYFDEYLEFLPSSFGAGCNYLGGGLRGSVMTTGDKAVFEEKGFSKAVADELGKLAEACKERYISLEGAMNDEEVDGETNWEAVGTNKMRQVGMERAY